MQTGLYVIAIGDCDGDGVPDDVELALEDCNGNGMADDCDRASYGDVDGNELVDLDDLTCLLEALSGLEACQPAEPGDLDIFPCETGDGDLNLHDLLNLLDALSGSPACPASCS